MTQIVKQYKNLFGSNVDLILVSGDITQLNGIDAIVMPTGSHFQHSGGCARAIVNAAGSRISSDFSTYLNQNSYLEYGTIFVTSSHNLNRFSSILAVRSPDHNNYSLKSIPMNGKLINLLELTFSNLILKAFVDLKLKSFATPLIGTGINGILVNDCITDLVTSIINFINNINFSGLSTTNNRQIVVIDYQLNNITDLMNYIKLQFNDFHPVQSAQSSVSTASSSTNANSSVDNSQKIDAKGEECVICLEEAGSKPNTFAKKLDKCSHIFCNTCIDDYFKKVKAVCPVCNTQYGIVYGNQPDGTMNHSIQNSSLPGFDRSIKTIKIDYYFPNGTQGPNHPNPGKHYFGTSRTAYLPDNLEGRRVLDLLKKSFDLKHTFTIGTSRTTGRDNVVTWNDIHHKTSMTGGPSNYGYPDPTYLNRVQNELAAKGIF